MFIHSPPKHSSKFKQNTFMNPIILILSLLIISCMFFRSESTSRSDFPHGFTFGTASSAFQFEGAVDEGNKGVGIWDTFSRIPGRILDFSNADQAVDQYHRFKNVFGGEWINMVEGGEG
ncbi:putative beta-glucosidase [Helianthus annuus]|nr:putative beta-glucosidase [Helianthus annuus]KAJ0865887.1 putative beta-glucosidase [Helianthus annuus]